MQTILVAVDGSIVTSRAVTMATNLAAALGARVVAVSVLDGDPGQADAVRAGQRLVETTGRQLGIEVSVSSSRVDGVGDVGRQYVTAILATKPDLVVLPTTDQPGTLGASVERVLHSGDVPVLVVPPPS